MNDRNGKVGHTWIYFNTKFDFVFNCGYLGTFVVYDSDSVLTLGFLFSH